MKKIENEKMTQEEIFLTREKATMDWYLKEEAYERENKRLHDIVQKKMQPLFDRNRRIVLEKMKKENTENKQ